MIDYTKSVTVSGKDAELLRAFAASQTNKEITEEQDRLIKEYLEKHRPGHEQRQELLKKMGETMRQQMAVELLKILQTAKHE